MSEPLAKDVLAELELREVVGWTTTWRVGQRAWARPRVAVSGRIYNRYKLGDPWEPKSKGLKIEVGPVSLRLSEKRRQPAPHLKPKERKPKQKALPKAPPKPKRVATPPPSPKPVAPPPASGEFGGVEIPELKGLPVRPDLQAALGKPKAPPESPPDPPERSLPPVSATPTKKRGTPGRMGLRRTEATGPTVRKVERPPVEIKEAVEKRAAPPRRVQADSLDDLFGAAAQEGRMSLGKKKKKDTE